MNIYFLKSEAGKLQDQGPEGLTPIPPNINNKQSFFLASIIYLWALSNIWLSILLSYSLFQIITGTNRKSN